MPNVCVLIQHLDLSLWWFSFVSLKCGEPITRMLVPRQFEFLRHTQPAGQGTTLSGLWAQSMSCSQHPSTEPILVSNQFSFCVISTFPDQVATMHPVWGFVSRWCGACQLSKKVLGDCSVGHQWCPVSILKRTSNILVSGLDCHGRFQLGGPHPCLLVVWQHSKLNFCCSISWQCQFHIYTCVIVVVWCKFLVGQLKTGVIDIESVFFDKFLVEHRIVPIIWEHYVPFIILQYAWQAHHHPTAQWWK